MDNRKYQSTKKLKTKKASSVDKGNKYSNNEAKWYTERFKTGPISTPSKCPSTGSGSGKKSIKRPKQTHTNKEIRYINPEASCAPSDPDHPLIMEILSVI